MAIRLPQIRALFQRNTENPGHWLAGEFAMPALLATPAPDFDGTALPAPRLPPEVFTQMASLVGRDRLRQDDNTRAGHARGRGYQDLLKTRAGDFTMLPDAVLFPRNEEDIAQLLTYCAARSIGVVAFGTGQSRYGGTNSAPGQISLDISGMDRLIGVDMQARIVTVEAGIGLAMLDKLLAVRGLALGEGMLPALGTLGGWIAQSRAAENSLVGGRMVTAHGVISFDAPSAPAKSLMLGSEGALGIITQATLRLRTRTKTLPRGYFLPSLAHGLAALRAAPDGAQACLQDAQATQLMRKLQIREGKPRSWLEDAAASLRVIAPGACLLTISCHTGQDARQVDRMIRQNGGVKAPPADDTSWPDEGLLNHGIGVEQFEAWASWEKLPSLHTSVVRALEAAMQNNAPRPGARGRVMAQITDASQTGATITLHALFPRMLNDEMKQARAIRQAGMDAIVAQGGQIGSFGLGDGNLAWAQSEPVTRRAFLGIKAALDPENILNPGKSRHA